MQNKFLNLLQAGLLISIPMILSGCGLFHSFVDARREAGQVMPVGSSTSDRPVICYGVDSPEKVESLAQNECAKTGRVAVLEKTEYFSCALFAPQKAVYRCEVTDKPVAPYQSDCAIDELSK